MTRYLLLWLLGAALLSAPRGARLLLPETHSAPQSCTNHRDDDGDFLADCEERDCWAHPSCQPPACDADQCQRPECELSPSCFEAGCSDHQDNDQDGAVDCHDPDCDTFFGCAIELCSDQEDNDQDGAVDCEDPQCLGLDGCLAASCVGACLGPERCDDSRDNDQDGLFDCRDPDCFASAPCGGKRDLGAGCSQGIQCASGSCLSELNTGYPDGLCSKECLEDPDCPQGSLCTTGLCHSSCEESDDCRDGYSCLPTGTGAVCLPDCSDAADCPDSGVCNLYSGYCAAELGLKRDITLCQEDQECESGRCIDGFCTSLCDGERNACPANFTCRIERGASDAGTCVPKSFGVGYVAPWDQPQLLPQLYEEQQLSSSVVPASLINDSASSLFSVDKVHTIQLSLSKDERQKLALGEKEWARAAFSFDGETLDEIGVRLKGGDGSGEELPEKAAFSLRFDAFTNGLSFYGAKKLALNNSNQDPSYLSEPLTYWLYQRYGIPAPRTAFAEVYLDGELYGLYVLVEAKDKIFMESRFGVSGPLYEGTYGADFDQVDLLEEHIAGGLPTLETLQNFLLLTPERELLPQLGSLIDVDQFFLAWAIDSFFDHWDGYFFEINNFYVYQDKDSRLRLLPHGADQLFGTRDTRIDATPSGSIAMRLARSMSVKDRFLREVERVMTDPSLEDELRAKVDSLLILIDDAAKRDTRRRSNEAEREIFSLWIREYIRARRDFIEASQVFSLQAP